METLLDFLNDNPEVFIYLLFVAAFFFAGLLARVSSSLREESSLSE